MKISPAVVRRLRLARGWPQEQLAQAAGLSLRTIQRVEADGTASLATRASLAATFAVPLESLSLPSAQASPHPQHAATAVAILFIGIAVVSCVGIVESGRLPGEPLSAGQAVLNALLGLMGIALAAPAAFHLAARGRVTGVVLAVMGMPLVVLLAAGLTFSVFSGRFPMAPLLAFGGCGLVLVGMALRHLRDTAPQPR